jgi:cell division protein FtsB
MPFTVADFSDLVQLLERQPEWRAELRRLLLTEELLSLPQTVQVLAEDVRALAEAQRRTEEQLATLTQRVDGLAEQMATLARRVDSLTQDIQLMVKRVDSLGQDIGELKGIGLEFRYQRLAYAYFQRLLRRIYVLSPAELSTLLEDAIDEGKLSYSDMEEIIRADLVVRGQRREDGAQAYLVVELSWGVGPSDVERAAYRAKLLAQLGAPVIPVVAGKAITSEAADLAQRLETWLVMDGRAISPTESI